MQPPANVPSSPWPAIRKGDLQLGMQQLLVAYQQDQSASKTIGLGVGYLWCKEYDAAGKHFENAIAKGDSMSSFFELAGAAWWCLGQTDRAVACWRTGLSADYADSVNGPVGLRALLFAASVLDEKLISRTEAVALLRESVRRNEASIWGTALPRICLGESTVDLDLARARYGAYARKTRASFYRSIWELGEALITKEHFNANMKSIADTSSHELDDTKAFTSLLWKPEFFIARHEAARAVGTL